MTRILFDTNILIDYIKNVPDAVALLDNTPDAMTSVITHIELLVSARTPAEEKGIEAFLQTFETIELDNDVALEAARLKRHQLQTGARKMQMPDLVILASATTHSATIYTLNTKDFPASSTVVHPYPSVANTAPTIRQQAMTSPAADGNS